MERGPSTSTPKSINTLLGGQIADLQSQLEGPQSGSALFATRTSRFKSLLGLLIRGFQPNLRAHHQPCRIRQFQIDSQSQSTIARPHHHYDFKFAHLAERSGLHVSIFVSLWDQTVAVLCDVLWSRSRAFAVIGFRARTGRSWRRPRKSHTRSRSQEKNHLKVRTFIFFSLLFSVLLITAFCPLQRKPYETSRTNR